MNLREPTDIVVTATGPADVPGLVPYLLGFHPEESLVVLCLRGAPSRPGLVMRLDLPAAETDDHYLQEVVTRVGHERPTGVLLVLYTDDQDAAGALPRQGLVDALAEMLVARSMDLLDALLVRNGRWWSYTCRGHECCPPEGSPCCPASSELARLGAEAAVRGQAPLQSRADLEASVCGPAGAKLGSANRAFERAERRLHAERRTDGADATRDRTVTMVRSVLTRFVDGACDLTDDDAARICAGLTDVRARDDLVSLPVAEPGAWIALLVDLARRTPDQHAAPICTTLAWVAYEQGDGALANVALSRALAAEPGYRLAVMLGDALDRQLPPWLLRSVSETARGRT